MTAHEMEVATMALDDLLRGANENVGHMSDAYWGAKMMLEEMGVRVTERDGRHSLLSVAD